MRHDKSILPALLVLTAMASLASQARANETWTNAGTKAVHINSSFAPPSLTRYVKPGQEIRFHVQEPGVVENDTKFNCGVEVGQEDDPTKEARLFRDSGTIQNLSFDESFNSPIPAGATAGQTVIIKLTLGDTRNAGDARHDATELRATWTFEVDPECPEGIDVDSLTDISGNQPAAGKTYGMWRSVMVATGPNPSNRANWNGTTVNETLGAIDCNDTTEFVQGEDGREPEEGGTFTFGAHADNKFKDEHGYISNTIKLRTGVNNAGQTLSQKYVCSATAEYNFTITFKHARLANPERVKVTVEKTE